MKQAARIGLGLALTGVFLFWAFRGTDWREVGDLAMAANWWWLFLALSCLVADYSLRITRWWLMLRVVQPGLPWLRAARPFLGSYALNNVMPLRAGDVFRCLRGGPMTGTGRSAVLATLLVERLMDVVAILTFFGLGLLWIEIEALDRRLTAGVAVVMLFAGVIAATCLFAARPLHRLIMGPWLEARLGQRHRVRKFLTGACAHALDTVALLASPKRAGLLLGISLAAWALEGGIFAACALALRLDDLGYAPWFAMSLASLATMIPSAPGYLGTFNLAVVVALEAFHVSHAGSRGMALLTHLLLVVPVTVVGLLWLNRRQRAPVAPAA